MKIKIVSQNVRHSNDGEGHMVADRLPRICSLIEKYDPDLVGFQEVRQKWLEGFTAQFGDHYEIHHKYRAQMNQEATTMMWKKDKFDCLEKGWFWLSPTPHIESHSWPCGSDYSDWRIVMWATLKEKTSGAIFTYFNTHYSFGDERHTRSNQLIRDHIREKHIDAAIITADFNFSNTSAGYRDMVKTFGDLNVDTVNDPRTTFTGYRHGREGSPIDFMFYTQNTIKPLTYHLMDEMFDGYFASDHFGIYGEFEVQEKLRIGSLDIHADAEDTEKLCIKVRNKYTKSILQYNTDREIVCWQGVTEDFLADWPAHYNRFAYVGEVPNLICYRPDLVVPKEVRKLDLDGEEGTLAIFEKCASGRTFCVMSGALHSESAAEVVLEEAEKLAHMPVFFAGACGTVESAPYNALCRKMQDLRRLLTPKNFVPTYQGYEGEWCSPSITEMIFSNMKGQKGLSYEVQGGQYGKLRVTDHNQVLVDILLENEE